VIRRYRRPSLHDLRRLQVFALGFVSVYDQILESLPEAERSGIFSAYIDALGEEPAMYSRDAQGLEAAASSLSGPDALVPDASGSDVQASSQCRARHIR
jgi:hypothetical protein